VSDAPADVPTDTIAGARAQSTAQKLAKAFRTLFSNAGVGSVSEGNVPDAVNIRYEADIPTPSNYTTGIQPTICTIEADGTNRYFDLQGRMLSGKPAKGLYIDHGRKVIGK